VVLDDVVVHDLTNRFLQVIAAFGASDDERDNRADQLQKDIAGFVVNFSYISNSPAQTTYPPIGTNPLSDLQLAVAFLFACIQADVDNCFPRPGCLSINSILANWAWNPPVPPAALPFSYDWNVDVTGDQALGVIGISTDKTRRQVQRGTVVRVLQAVGSAVGNAFVVPGDAAEYTGNSVHGLLLSEARESTVISKAQVWSLTSPNGHVRGLRLLNCCDRVQIRDASITKLTAGPPKNSPAVVTITAPNPVPTAVGLFSEPSTTNLIVGNLVVDGLYGYGASIPTWLGSCLFSTAVGCS
jgi:hypothetical protein